MPKISVVVPIYNVEKYLNKCIDSLLNQSFLDFELILVDDGSPDQCGKICDDYSQRDKRIKVIHKKNGGLSSARNAGLDIARGEIITFVDSDDYVEKDYLDIISSCFEDDISMLSFQYKTNRGGNETIFPKRTDSITSLEDDKDRYDFLINDIYKKNNWSVWSHAYKKSIIENANLRFEDNNKIFAEDMYFLFAYCSLIKKERFISKQIYYYRIRDNSIMSNEFRKLNVGRMNELSKALRRFYTENLNQYFLDHFAMIHYLIVFDNIRSALLTSSLDAKQIRASIYGDIEDIDFFKEQLIELIKMKDDFYTYISSESADHDYSFLKYLYDGSEIKRKCRTVKYILKNHFLRSSNYGR